MKQANNRCYCVSAECAEHGANSAPSTRHNLVKKYVAGETKEQRKTRKALEQAAEKC